MTFVGHIEQRVWWLGRLYKRIPGVTMHGSGDATTPRFLSRKDRLVHAQRSGTQLALGLCGLRYNIYRRNGMRGLKGIPTESPVTCLACIAEGG